MEAVVVRRHGELRALEEPDLVAIATCLVVVECWKRRDESLYEVRSAGRVVGMLAKVGDHERAKVVQLELL
jgi:hypothetical protein